MLKLQHIVLQELHSAYDQAHHTVRDHIAYENLLLEYTVAMFGDMK